MSFIAICYAVFGVACFMLGRLQERRYHERRRLVTPLQRALVHSWGNSVRRARMTGISEGWAIANAPKEITRN